VSFVIASFEMLGLRLTDVGRPRLLHLARHYSLECSDHLLLNLLRFEDCLDLHETLVALIQIPSAVSPH
jgi:hypothetical protein